MGKGWRELKGKEGGKGKVKRQGKEEGRINKRMLYGTVGTVL